MLSIGLMSGTSMDGVDAALIETDGSQTVLREIAHHFIPYEPSFKMLLKATELAIRSEYSISKNNILERSSARLEEYIVLYLKSLQVGDIDSVISEMRNTCDITIEGVIKHSAHIHYMAVEQLLAKSGSKTSDIGVIGYHGQTFLHKPDEKISIILSDGEYIARRSGIKTVVDFRSADVAAGGKGAPFAPIYHLALSIRDKKLPCAVVNCGGIGNITALTSEDESQLVGFDTGPGNALIDKIVRIKTNGAEVMDLDGKYGLKGVVHEDLLPKLYDFSIVLDGQNYFAVQPPKALDIGDINFIPEILDISLEDACATLAAFTADSILSSTKWLERAPLNWILAGGGWKNPVILKEFKSRAIKFGGTEVVVQTAIEAGWDADAIEAQLMAYLAVRSLNGAPISFPGTTSVPMPMTGGVVHY